MCWYCYWGLPEPIATIKKRAEEELDGDDGPLEFGPSHIVWSDCNFEDHNIDFCLRECDTDKEYDKRTLDIIRRSLRELKKVPEEYRSMPDMYLTDDDPWDPWTDDSKYPPPPGWEMVRE